jgi:hypothetical protein
LPAAAAAAAAAAAERQQREAKKGGGRRRVEAAFIQLQQHVKAQLEKGSAVRAVRSSPYWRRPCGRESAAVSCVQ